MKKFYFLRLLWYCAYLLPLVANANQACTAEFKYSAIGRTVSFFSANDLPAGTTHWWTFGDATNSPEANPIHTFANAGTYWVTHYILNENANCRDSFVRSITVTDTVICNIQAKFSWKRDSANCLKIRFLNESTPISPNVHFVWMFGDGTMSNEINPSHIYAQPGVYTVCLVIETNNGCRKEVCQQVEVRCNTSCNIQADFSWKRDSAQPNKIYFKSLLLTPVTGVPLYKWTFGDGGTSTEANPTHVYQRPGVYKVCLRIAISNTCVAEICKEVRVETSSACDVRAKFEWKRDPSQWNKIWFANLSQPIQNIWRTHWTYGDGTSSQDFNSFHVYQQPGRYYVCLKVQSLNGCTNTYCDTVIVRAPGGMNCDDVKLKFEYKRDPQKPYRLSFYAISNLPIVQQQWSIVKLSNIQIFPPPVPVLLNVNNPTYSFKDSGWYMVCLYAITSNNCKKIYCERIYIEHGENGRLSTSAIPIYPNPANRLVRLEVKVETATTLQIRVLDGTGSPKIQFASPAMAGNNTVVIPVEKLSNGLYIVEIRYGNQVKLAKFQKS